MSTEKSAKQIVEIESFDTERVRKAARAMDALRNARVFDAGKTGVEIIREWRERRK